MATNTPVSIFKFVEPSANWITKVVVSNQVDTEDRISPNQQMMYHMLVPPRRFHFIASQKGYEHPTKGTYNYGICWLEILFQRMAWTHGRRQNGGGFVGNAGMGMMGPRRQLRHRWIINSRKSWQNRHRECRCKPSLRP